MSVNFDRNGHLKPFKEPLSSTVICCVGFLSIISGVFLIIAPFIIRGFLPIFILYGVLSIVAGCFFTAFGRAAQDLHHIRYMMARHIIKQGDTPFELITDEEAARQFVPDEKH